MPPYSRTNSARSAQSSPGDYVRPDPTELLVAAAVGINLCFLPWAFGGVDLWAQWASAGLGALAFGLALRSRPRRATAVSLHEISRPPWARLAGFPVFWAGVLLFAYVAAQALNPAFDYYQSGSDWWLTPRARVPWLPAGMHVPFADAGPARAMLLWFPPWAVMCAVRLAITRRSVVIGLLNVVAANGFLFAAFGLVQRAGGGSHIYGFRAAPRGDFFAGFIYKNHASAYLNLIAMVAAALAVHTFWRNRQRPGRHGPAILQFLFAVTLMLAVVLTYSLSGVIVLGLSLLLLLPVTLIRLRQAFPPPSRAAAGIAVALLVSVLVGSFAAAAGYDRLRERIVVKLDGEGRESALTRIRAARQGLAMFQDRWLFGWGAGCFRYGFTKYQHQDPVLSANGPIHFFWEHLHCDWLETLTELGVTGALAVAVIIGYWIRQAVRQRCWQRPALAWLTVGLVGLAAHAAIDFPGQNSAILVTVGALLPLLLRWSEHNVTTRIAARTSGDPGL